MDAAIVEFFRTNRSSPRHENPSFLENRLSLSYSKEPATFLYLTEDKSSSKGLIQFLSDPFEYKLTDLYNYHGFISNMTVPAVFEGFTTV